VAVRKIEFALEIFRRKVILEHEHCIPVAAPRPPQSLRHAQAAMMSSAAAL